MHDLGSWSSYYVITGSSAAALTGLMFVVITIVAGQERLQSSISDGVETFSSPTVVHFCAALLVSALLSAPWHSLVAPGVLLGLTGAYGVMYAARVMLRMTRLRLGPGYTAGFDDWFWYALMPLLAYSAVLIAGALLSTVDRPALFALAGCTITLIFVGIRNAWDTVTFIAVVDSGRNDRPGAA